MKETTIFGTSISIHVHVMPKGSGLFYPHKNLKGCRENMAVLQGLGKLAK